MSAPPDALTIAREALDELCESVSAKLGTINYHFGPGARTAVSRESVAAYERIVAAVERGREVLADVSVVEPACIVCGDDLRAHQTAVRDHVFRSDGRPPVADPSGHGDLTQQPDDTTEAA